ncbi:hypothetical protein Acr_02g0014460 [Actinidia rufa]|uniref:Uncharacterized protein n=1 Tax=Actinidia rufa TaxID=165716 RepID=A0A7J0EAJ6_9ERIC|nr:hypothetical protein Acr_02g0014460 [Actinidia rufa]
MGKNEARGFVAGGACFGKARGDRVRKSRECDEGESDRIELTPDLVGAVTSLCVIQRKKRMARQRRSSLNVLDFLARAATTRTSDMISGSSVKTFGF